MLGYKYKPYVSLLFRQGSHPSAGAREAEEDRVDSLIRADMVNRTVSMMEIHPDLIRAKQEYRERLRKQFEQGWQQADPEVFAQMRAGASAADWW